MMSAMDAIDDDDIGPPQFENFLAVGLLAAVFVLVPFGVAHEDAPAPAVPLWILSWVYVGALGVAGTYGLAAWALGRYSRNRTMQHVATGLLAVAAAEFASGATGAAAPATSAGVMGGTF